MNLRKIAAAAARAVTDFVYPSRAVCLGCGSAAGQAEPWLCADCAAALKGDRPKETDGRIVCHKYHGPAGALVRNLKYHGVTALAEPMGRQMARRVLNAGWTIDAVTCVPMHPKRRRTRGYNQSELLARVIAAELGAPYQDLLTRTRNTPQQARLNAEQRRTNLKDAFAASGCVGKRILLVDDVFTTGETSRTCAEEMTRDGAAEVRFVMYATDN